jgi:hypothetical protein
MVPVLPPILKEVVVLELRVKGRLESNATPEVVKRVPPLPTTVLVTAPRLLSLPIERTPPERVTPPLKVLAPERVKVPEDWLTRLPVPEITPVYDPVPVTVKVAVPRVMLPVPERLPIVLL